MRSQAHLSERGNSLLASAKRYPALVALLCTDEAIYLSGPASIWKLDPSGGEPQRLASVPLPWPYRQAARWLHLRRLGRLDVRELIQVPKGDLLGISQKQVISIKNNDSGEIRPVLQVRDGGRPKGFALTPSGRLFVGEYWRNPRRQALRIWASSDQGETWGLACTLPAGSAKHIHNIVWDQYRQGLWTLTGDGDGECALLFTADEFQTLTEIIRGGQMYRACHLFCRPAGLYYGTDTERAPNWFLHLEVDTGKIEKIQPLPGSCIYGARMADQYFISTAVEPSTVNLGQKAVLWSSSDLQNWIKNVEIEKDCWPGEYMGFGRIILPRIQGDCLNVIFSTIAVKYYDINTFIHTNINSKNNTIAMN